MNKENAVNKETLELIFEEILESYVVEDEEVLMFPKMFKFDYNEFNELFEAVMEYANERELSVYEFDYYSSEKTYVEYNGQLFKFEEITREKEIYERIIELSDEKITLKFTYEDFKNN